MQTDEHVLLVGVFAGSLKQGIQTYRFNSRTGEARFLAETPCDHYSSWLTASGDGRFVYCVNEQPDAAGNGGVIAFRADRGSGKLTLINRASCAGQEPCHLARSPEGKFLVVANYAVAAVPGGNFAVLPLYADGSLGEPAQVVPHQGSGPVAERQGSAHAHSAVFTPDGRYLVVQDLGADALVTYRYTAQAANAPIALPAHHRCAIAAGSGPRHLAFRADGRYAYLVNELNATLCVLSCDDGAFSLMQTLPLAQPGYSGRVGAAAIHLSADERFLYVSNREDANQIIGFALDAESGQLELLAHWPSGGMAPREFTLDPSGRWLLVGNQASDQVTVLRRDPATGLLEPTDKNFAAGAPAAFLWLH